MFSMSGLYPEQVNELREKYHVYLFPTGRISLTGCKLPQLSRIVEFTQLIHRYSDRT